MYPTLRRVVWDSEWKPSSMPRNVHHKMQRMHHKMKAVFQVEFCFQMIPVAPATDLVEKFPVQAVLVDCSVLIYLCHL